MFEIQEVKTRKQRKQFVEFPLKLYKKNPWFVPPLYGDEMKVFTQKNVYHKVADSVFYLAYEDGKVVGRIQGIIQRQYNEIHDTKQTRFTRFDCVYNKDIATALLSAVEKWGEEKGMDHIVGPLGYSDLEREGLLIEGFDELSTFEEQYNFPYYQKLIENCGYEKDVDWVEYKVYKPDVRPEKLKIFAENALRRHNLKVVSEKMSTAKIIDTYQDGIFHCLDECYKHLYGVVPFTEEMKNQIIEQFKMLVNKEFVVVITDEKDNVVAFGLCLPSISKAVQKSGGRLTPFTLLKLLKSIKKPDILDLALVAVMPEHRHSGLNAVILDRLQSMLEKKYVKYCETNLELEENTAVQAQWKYFNSIQHKRRRSFIKKFD